MPELLADSERFTKTAGMLKLLSNPNRLMILYILSEAHKIVSFKKTGQMSIYSISDERFVELLKMLREINV